MPTAKKTGTRVYGTSDDLMEFEGDVSAEVVCYNLSKEKPLAMFFSDGTVLHGYYNKNNAGIWGIDVVEKGSLFDRIEICTDEDAEPYSDQVFFKPGLKWARHGEDGRKVD